MTEHRNDQAHIRAWVECADWTFAKTVPETPHEYVVIRGGDGMEFLRRFRRHAAEHGYSERFLGRSYRYVDLDGWRYWTNTTRGGLWFLNRASGHADGSADEAVR